jgi:hypothetical protein
MMIAAAAALFTGGEVLGQCADCAISVERLASLGDEREAPVGPIHTIAVFDDGRHALSFDASSDEILIFEPDGRFQRTVGRSGSGPGEFQFIRFLRGAGRGFAAFDTRLKQVMLFGPNLTLLRTLPLELDPLGDALVLSDSSFALNAIDPPRDRVGPLVHIVTPSGTARSFAADPEGFRFDLAFSAGRLLAASSTGIWVAHRTSYTIDEYSLDGQRRRTVERKVDWFPRHTTPPHRPGPDGPAPYIIDVREDDGLLWVLIAVAARDWSSALDVQTPEGRTYSDRSAYFDTRIEVLDPATGALVATTRVDPFLAGFHGPGLTSSYEEVGGATPRIAIWKLRLAERTEPARPGKAMTSILPMDDWHRKDILNQLQREMWGIGTAMGGRGLPPTGAT